MQYILIILFSLIPIAAVAFFVTALCLFIISRNKNKQLPGSVDEQTLYTNKVMLIISSVIIAVIAAIVIGLIILIASSIKYM